MKKLLVIFLAVVTLLSCSANALALGETENINDEIDLCYLYTNGVTSLISIKSKQKRFISIRHISNKNYRKSL